MQEIDIAPSELKLKIKNLSPSVIKMDHNLLFLITHLEDKKFQYHRKIIEFLKKDELAKQFEVENCQYDGITWDYNFNPPRNTRAQFFISYINKKEIQYIQNGSILRIDQVQDHLNKSELLHNLEQIKYLFWLGQYGNNNLKVGKWIATWKGEQLKNVGGMYNQNKKLNLIKSYSNKGEKQGLWKELIKDYWIKSQVYEVGEYANNYRKGTWKFIYCDKEIGGGDYNQNSQKNGKWVELSDGFWDYQQVIFNGMYRNGKKIGKWNILYRSYQDKSFQLIGGGCYDVVDQSKIGRWNELNNGLYNSSLVTNYGVYKNNKKVGKWNIFYQSSYNKPFELIGGGCYDQEGHVKIGIWIELNDNFQKQSEVTFIGEYKKGEKVGKWEILYRSLQDQAFELIGGGSYNQVGSIKNGKWIDQSDRFWKQSQVTYHGEYDNGKKIGKWDIFYRSPQAKALKLIGGGLYNEVGSIKNGKWIELCNEFWFYSQFIQNGEYNNGQKVGKWEEIDIQQNQKRKEINF